MAGQYNSGMSVGVKPFQQSSTRTGEFFSGSMPTSNGTATSLQQTNPGGYRPASVIGQFTSSPNGMSPTTYEANRTLSYYRQ
jgi:hypothetical protein